MNRRTFHKLALNAGAATCLQGSEGGKPKIKIGQIGTKHAHAGGQMASMRSCADYEVVGVVEPDEARRQQVMNGADYAGLPWMSEDELLKIPGLLAVSVETDVGGLLDAAQKVVNAGFHLHLDKPAGESLPAFQKILEVADQKKLLVKMGYMFRYNPAFEFMIKAVREGWLGEIFSIHAEMSKKLGDDERGPMLRYTGGSMFELGCHLIDSVVRVLGKPAEVTPFIRHGADGYGENMLAVLEYPKATVSVRSAMVEVEGGARRQFVVCGSKGTCEIRPLEPPGMKLMLDEAREGYRKGVQDVKFERLPRYLADWVDFARAIRGETSWEFNSAHDLAVQETVLRASGMKLT